MNQLETLKAEIENINPLSSRIDALNELAWRWRYREKEQALQHTYKDSQVTVNISIGISEFTGKGALVPSLTLDELIHQADQALYTAKKNGRNCVEVFVA